jgi:hypothetical protein
MIGTLYVSRVSGKIYICIDIEYAHVPIFTLTCENGEKQIVSGTNQLDTWFKPMLSQENE